MENFIEYTFFGWKINNFLVDVLKRAFLKWLENDVALGVVFCVFFFFLEKCNKIYGKNY